MLRMKRLSLACPLCVSFPYKFDRIINAITATAFLFRKVHKPMPHIGAIMFAMLSVGDL